jgi:hypothetical protein
MTDKFYRIRISWRDSKEDTTIICPSGMVLGIVETLPKFVIKSMEILPVKEASYDE